MTKFILCLFILFSIYICEEPPKNLRIFERKSKETTISVRLGEEFVIKLVNHPSIGFTWKFLNKNDVQESIQFLRSYEREQYGRIIIIGNPRNVYYQFKAVNKTNEAVPLKFYYGKYRNQYLEKDINNFKINVQ